ncbi:MAG: S1C family serine protease [Nitrososphaerales archaeon]
MKRNSKRRFGLSHARGIAAAGIIVIVVLSGLLYYSSYLSTLKDSSQITTTVTQTVISTVQGSNATSNFNPVAIYRDTNESVVTVSGAVSQLGGNLSGQILGSGIVIDFHNAVYIVTNFHVVDSVTNMTVTFWDGDAYPAKTVGYDPYADLAVVTTQAPVYEFHPLNFSSSSLLQVGETIVAIGNPYGLSGSMTVGIVSQLGRTLQEQTTGNFSIANIIQFSAPINPGNSGGPLLDANGNVIGITTAIVGGSQGVGFAIPSDTITRELPSLIVNGTYTRHPFLGIIGTDMNYQLAQAIGSYATYGVLIEQLFPSGPADKAGLLGGNKVVTVDGQQYIIGGDVIVSMNGTRIVSYDAMASYMEARTLPGQTLMVGIIRSGALKVIPVILGVRPQ